MGVCKTRIRITDDWLPMADGEFNFSSRVEGWRMLNQIPSEEGIGIARPLLYKSKRALLRRKRNPYDAGHSQAVTHPSTDLARPGLTSMILDEGRMSFEKGI